MDRFWSPDTSASDKQYDIEIIKGKTFAPYEESSTGVVLELHNKVRKEIPIRHALPALLYCLVQDELWCWKVVWIMLYSYRSQIDRPRGEVFVKSLDI